MSIIDLGAIRASDKHIIQLNSYDPYPTTGPSYYRFTADNIWRPFTNYNEGDWVVYFPSSAGGVFYGGQWSAASNTPTLADGMSLQSGTFYTVNATATLSLGSGLITFEIGDIVVYNGATWSKVAGKDVTRICLTSHYSGNSYNPALWTNNALPPYYNLDASSGALYADLPYLPFYSQTYNFTIRIDKHDALTAQIAYVNQQFKLVIKGQIDNAISFITPSNLGSLNTGYLSELAVVATHQYDTLSITYTIIAGELPPGLSLGFDGSIIGRVDYGADLGQYNFSVRATDLYNQIIEKDFYINVTKYDDLTYTQIYVRPFLLKDSRYDYSVFITDPSIFESSKMYRPADPNFGVQREIKMYLEYGIQRVRLSDYVEAMVKCFTKKKVFFGEVKTVPAQDEYGDYVYDVVYVEIIDPLENANGDFVESFVEANTLVYPNSIGNMRRALELIEIDGAIVKTDEYQLPKWMRTPQSSGVPLNYVTAVVLCYTSPNMGSAIVKNIRDSGFSFNTINFDIDRLVIEDNLSVSGVRYMPFFETASTQVNLATSNQDVLTTFVLGTAGPLTGDDGSPITI
jgi:hypothetical protein